ncbi:MAG: FHA domain-containing protein [Prevotella sp.]|jgi:pSer/pThr/pTyr-binding forkhead associated (FHA) protein|nr:FHA domain-containing protein [Prevotella sp.]
MKVITIGRSRENDIVINDGRVSRNHLQIVKDNNGNYSVIDLGSSNGTFVNGERLTGTIRLQPNDKVQIGSTILPWQSYFVDVVDVFSSKPVPDTPIQKNKLAVWYIVAAVSLLLLVGGGVVWFLHVKKQEKIEAEATEKQKKLENEAKYLETEATDARIAAIEASGEAEKAARIAAESKSKKDLEYAEKMKAEAEAKQKFAGQKEKDAEKYKAEKEKILADMRAAEAKSKQDSSRRKDAEKAASEAKKEAQQAIMAKTNAEKKAELTIEFYKIFTKVDNSFLGKDYPKMVCDELEWKPTQKKDKKKYIEEQFDKADNAQKQKIINAINKVLSQQSNNDKTDANAEKTKPDPIN